jgi:hypothetical protein
MIKAFKHKGLKVFFETGSKADAAKTRWKVTGDVSCWITPNAPMICMRRVGDFTH